MYDVVVLEHDTPSTNVRKFFERRWKRGTARLNITRMSTGTGTPYEQTMYDSCEIENTMKPLSLLRGNPIVMYGNGSYHHYTYGLTANIMKPRCEEYLYIHIDYHTDAAVSRSKCVCDQRRSRINFFKRCGGRTLGCGNFVEELKQNNAKNFLFIGTDSTCGWKRKEWVKQKTLLDEDVKSVIASELSKKRCVDAYVSMDLDVLDYPELPTCYGRGKIKLQHLLDVLSVIKEHKNIIAADILGLCKKGSGSYYDCTRDRSDGDSIRCAEDYYENVGFLTYGIIAEHLCGRDYTDAMKLRNRLLSKLKNRENGETTLQMMRGFKFC